MPVTGVIKRFFSGKDSMQPHGGACWKPPACKRLSVEKATNAVQVGSGVDAWAGRLAGDIHGNTVAVP